MITELNPNLHNLHNTMCFKTWNDIVISLPQRTVKWCCKTVYTPEQVKELTFDMDTLTEDFLFNHPILQQRKHDLSGGTYNKDCELCWKTERAGGNSVRTEYMKTFDYKLNKQWRKSKNHPKLRIDFHKQMKQMDNFRFIEIELTNKCNMACVYCWGGSSTRWQKELGQRFPDTDDLMFDKLIDILNDYWHRHLKTHHHVNFSLLGGEPFFTDHMFRFIRNFMININDTQTRKDQKVVITVTTNLNFPQKKFNEFIELVERTPNITYEMQLSGEALGRKSELIRWGLDFNKWNENLELFFEKSKEINNLVLGFGCAHNSLSLPYFKDFLVYMQDKINKFDYDKEIIMHSNWVDNPEHLSVSALDPKHADKIQEQIDYFENMSGNFMHKQKYISLMYTMKALVESKVEDNTKNFARKQFDMLENRRKISFSEHFPHFQELVTV
tara:strand:- start:80 stop:1405 length:1326 start_codon:yes stop_codon:yes gene_type:complete